MEFLVQKISLISLLLVLLAGNQVSATVFTLFNNCNHTIWPATICGNGMATLGDGGFVLTPGVSVPLPATAGWSGRFWARTGCNFDDNGNGVCSTGDCGSVLRCTGGGATPSSLAEFTLGTAGTPNDKDFYDVSLVDGYNVGVGITSSGGTGDCRYAGCTDDVNARCPAELQVVADGAVVACKSACGAFNTEEYCCNGAHATPNTCGPTVYSTMFKSACPSAYSYAYDDASSTFTCSAGSDYLITFCPTASA